MSDEVRAAAKHFFCDRGRQPLFDPAGHESFANSDPLVHADNLRPLTAVIHFFYIVGEMDELKKRLGDFERSILLALAKLGDDAYGVTIRNTLTQTLGRDVSFGAVYTTLDRLLQKKMVSTYTGEPTPQRGGRAKKHFRIERKGIEALERARREADAVWSLVPVRSER